MSDVASEDKGTKKRPRDDVAAKTLKGELQSVLQGARHSAASPFAAVRAIDVKAPKPIVRATPAPVVDLQTGSASKKCKKNVPVYRKLDAPGHGSKSSPTAAAATAATADANRRRDPFESGSTRVPIRAPSLSIQLPSFERTNGASRLTLADPSVAPDRPDLDTRSVEMDPSKKDMPAYRKSDALHVSELAPPALRVSELDTPAYRKSDTLRVSELGRPVFYKMPAPRPATNVSAKIPPPTPVGVTGQTKSHFPHPPPKVKLTSVSKGKTEPPATDIVNILATNVQTPNLTSGVPARTKRKQPGASADVVKDGTDDREFERATKVRAVASFKRDTDTGKVESSLVDDAASSPTLGTESDVGPLMPLNRKAAACGRSGVPAFVVPSVFANMKRGASAVVGSVRLLETQAQLRAKQRPNPRQPPEAKAPKPAARGPDVGTFVPFHSEDAVTSAATDWDDGGGGGGGGGGDDDGDFADAQNEFANDDDEDGCANWTFKRTVIEKPKEIADEDVLADDIRNGREYRVDPAVYAVPRHAEAKISDIPHLRPRITGVALQRYLASVAVPLSRKPEPQKGGEEKGSPPQPPIKTVGGEKYVEMMVHEVQEHRGFLHMFAIMHTPAEGAAAKKQPQPQAPSQPQPQPQPPPLTRKKGASVSIKLDFQPWFWINRPAGWGHAQLAYFQQRLNKLVEAASPFASSFGYKHRQKKVHKKWDAEGSESFNGAGADDGEDDADDSDENDEKDGEEEDPAANPKKQNEKERSRLIKCAFEARQRLIGFDFERLTPLIRVTCADLFTYRTTMKLFESPIYKIERKETTREPHVFTRYNHDCPFRQMFFSESGSVMYGTVAVPLRVFLEAAESTEKKGVWTPNAKRNSAAAATQPDAPKKMFVQSNFAKPKSASATAAASTTSTSSTSSVNDKFATASGGGGGAKMSGFEKHRTTCQIQAAMDWRQLVPIPHKQTIAPLLKLSFDIETVTGSKLGGFPKAARPHDMINYISNHFYWHGEATPFLSVLMCLGEIDSSVRTLEGHPHGVVVLQYSSEREMLLAWHEMAMVRNDVDELITYNGLFYDELWLLDRAKMLGISPTTSRMSKFREFEVEAKRIETTSNQSGDRIEYRIKMPGRTQFDVLKVVLREKKTLSSYQLKDVAPILIKFEGASEQEKQASRERYNKIDLPYNLLRPYFLLGPQKRTEIAVYCLRDSEITYRSAHDQQFFGNYYQMARLTQTQNNDLITAGETTKVMSMLWGHIQAKNWALNKDELTRLRAANPVTYIGATVLKPKPGLYTYPIATFDFGSLYPSIMCAENTCYSTILFDATEIARARADGYEVAEHFVQPNNVNNPHFVRGLHLRTPEAAAKARAAGHIVLDEVRDGRHQVLRAVRALLPEALKELLDKRKEAKKEMEQAYLAGDYALVAIFNGKQSAIKISANSVYGFCGADGMSAKAVKKREQAKEAGQKDKPAMAGPLPLVAIASSVTTKGREMIRATRAFFVRDRHQVIYGDTDSVMVFLTQAREHEYGDMTDAKTVRAEDLRALDRLIAICVEYSQRISATFTKPNLLNFEKIAPVFLLIAKKTYAAIVWEYKSPKAGAPEQAVIKGIDFKGVSCVRRDWCPFSRRLGEHMLKLVLKRRPLGEILDVFQTHVDMMVDDKVPLKDYLLTKKLKAHYGTKPPVHKEVALKMAERDPELAPPVGTRIQYVVCNNGETEFSKQGEEFEHALKTNMKPDLNYYFDKQIMKPILRTLVTVDTNIENLLMQTADHRLRAKMSSKKDVFAHFGAPSCPTHQSPTVAPIRVVRAKTAPAPPLHPKAATATATATTGPTKADLTVLSLRDKFKKNQALAIANSRRSLAAAENATAPSIALAAKTPTCATNKSSAAKCTAAPRAPNVPSTNATAIITNPTDTPKRPTNEPPSRDITKNNGNLGPPPLKAAPFGAPKPRMVKSAATIANLNANQTKNASAKQRCAVSALTNKGDVHPFFAGF